MDIDLQSLIPLLLIFLLCLFMSAKNWRRAKNKHLTSKLPPGPWKLPIIGSLHHLLSPLPHHTLRDLAREYGPLMHLQLGQVPTLVVSSAMAAKEIMKTHDLKFANRPEILSMKDASYGFRDIVMAPYGEHWRQLRKVCQLELLTAKRVESFKPIREDEVNKFIKEISSSCMRAINLTEMFTSLTNDITARVAFGSRSGYQELFITTTKEGLKLVGGLNVSDLFPSSKLVSLITCMEYKMRALHLKLDGILNGIIEEHQLRGQIIQEANERDTDDNFIDVLMKLKHRGDIEFDASDDIIKAVIMDVFVAGTESSSNVMSWAMSELVRNPMIMARAQEEVRLVLKGKERVSEVDLQQLIYLKLVIKETLRLHPSAPLLLPRECREDCEVNGYFIPAKTRVLVNAWAIARDPEFWGDDAAIFKPERFLNKQIDFRGGNFSFIPFGAGRRICPGITFGLANVELPLAQLLYHFDWKLPSGMKNENLDMTEEFGVAVGRKSNLCLIGLPRNPFWVE
ncbi:premnaspirodiene oxygenase-like [Aristolochia californica]|uniref:premnaspirodiene oxygenase-like n=1 Tax=Aristolochia californica TaxID=171875 RepID=UPI0035DBB078